MNVGMNASRKFTSKIASSVFAALAVVLLLAAGARPAAGQGLPCPGQNWTGTTPNVWAAEGSVKVMLNNQATTNQPSIPTYTDDGYFNPWGYQQHPQSMTELNPVWSCPSSGTPEISVAGAGRETVSFQVFITAAPSSVNSSALTGVTVGVTPLAGPGTTLTSDNTQTSNVLRYLEGYIPYTYTNPFTQGWGSAAAMNISGDMPDPLIPFYDPYDTGTPAVATPFNVQPGTTQAVWVDVTIPAGQTAGTYTGTVTVSGNGVSASIPVNLTVWNGTLPRFDSGSVNPAHADMLKSMMALWGGRFQNGEGLSCDGLGCSASQAMAQKYQVMAHNYDFDTFEDIFSPLNAYSTVWGQNTPVYPSTNPTSFTTGAPTGPGATGTTSTIDWTSWDAYYGPSLTAGGLFADGTSMRAIDSPAGTGGNMAWAWFGPNGSYGWDWTHGGQSTNPIPPDMLLLYTNFAEQISMHFTTCQTSPTVAACGTTTKWGQTELLAYTWDEPYHSSYLYDNPDEYEVIGLYNQALNNANTALSSTWDPSTNPVRNWLTDWPGCATTNDTSEYTNTVCQEHVDLSYPAGSLASPQIPGSWTADWDSNPSVYVPGAPVGGSQPMYILYDCGATALTAGTEYQYTLDMNPANNGVITQSTAPAPLSKWFYQGGEPLSSTDMVWNSGVGLRANFWIAYKYGLDETTPSVGNPSPTYAMPGGVYDWAAEFWNDSPWSSCGAGNYTTTGSWFFYPGNQLSCYNASGAIGNNILTQTLDLNAGTPGGIGGPVASIRMAQWRRGYEDYEYLYLLGHQGCPTSGVPAQCNRANVMAKYVNAMGGASMTSGGNGTTSWNALNWDNVDPGFESGVWPLSTPGYGGFSGSTTSCTDSNPGAGGLSGGLPYGPTGAGFSYDDQSGSGISCPGEWTNNPDRYAAMRVQMATDLGWATVGAAPTITSLTPNTGSTINSTTVVIAGTNFTGATAVLFGGNNASSFTVNSATQITAVAGPGTAGTVAVQVETPSGISGATNADLFSYVSPVTVTGVSPTAGVAAGGNTVTISGTYFNSGGATVSFGGVAATNVVVVSASSITATAPAGSGTVNIVVTTADGTSAINSSDEYTYELPPTVSGVTPNSGPSTGGTNVTVTGTGFVTGTTVTFGGVAATNVVVASSGTSLTATSPAYSTQSGAQVDVEVTTTYGTSVANGGDHFNYTVPVTITGLSVSGGPASGGTSVVITGTDFTGATAVMFGSNAAASYVVNSATQITAVSPAGGGVVNITVAASGYVSPTGSADLFSYASVMAGGTYASFPMTVVGATSSTQMVSITLTAASNISSITVPPAQNGKQEFTVGTGGTCVVGGSNAAGTCTVAVTFSPQYPGVRMGALQVNNGGGVVGTAGLAGIGSGPEVAQSPGSLTLYAGGGPTGVTATPEKAINAAFSVGGGDALAVGGAGNVYIADNNNCLAYKVNVATNQIVVIAGNYTYASGAVTPSTTPEPALGANTCPRGIAVDSAGNVYIVDANTTNSGGNNDTVEEVFAATGQIQVIAGGGSTVPSTTSGPVPALSASFNDVNSLATDEAGDLYISDYCNNLVDKLSPAGQVTLVAGGGSTAPSTTAEAATSAQLHGPTGVVADDAGNLYISDQCDNNVDQVNLATGNIVVVAGGGSNAPTTTPVLATSAKLNAPAELAVDGAGDLYIADDCNNLVEEVTGLTTTSPQLAIVAGGGGTAPSTTPQSAPNAHFGNVQGLAMDGVGNLYVADSGNNVVSKVNTQAMALSFGNVAANTTSVPQAVELGNIGNAALSLASL
ncbi:MAG: glycoside hydrolase domain-containing protein, partial [Cuniculiplasma sp.]